MTLGLRREHGTILCDRQVGVDTPDISPSRTEQRDRPAIPSHARRRRRVGGGWARCRAGSFVTYGASRCVGRAIVTGTRDNECGTQNLDPGSHGLLLELSMRSVHFGPATPAHEEFPEFPTRAVVTAGSRVDLAPQWSAGASFTLHLPTSTRRAWPRTSAHSCKPRWELPTRSSASSA